MYGDLPLSGIVKSDGTLTITIKPTGRQTWTVSQVSINMQSAPIGATALLKKNGALITPMVATGDAAGGDPAIDVRPAEKLTVEWAGCTAGQTGTVLVIYDDGQG